MSKYQLSRGQKIVFLGDSITDVSFNRRVNNSVNGKNIYAKQVAKALKFKSNKIKVKIKGIASNRSYHLYDRLTKDCIKYNPDFVCVLIGVNDAWQEYKSSEYPVNYRKFDAHFTEILRRLVTELPHSHVLVLLPFLINTIAEKAPFLPVLREYIAVAKNIANNFLLTTIDLQDLFDNSDFAPVQLARDGVHPTNLGHKQIADKICEYLEIQN